MREKPDWLASETHALASLAFAALKWSSLLIQVARNEDVGAARRDSITVEAIIDATDSNAVGP
jgi:hypothetical protein